MTHAAIRKLVVDSVATALEAQAATMENTNNPNRNSRLRRTHIARKCTYGKFMSCQPFYFNGTDGSVGHIHWFKQTESVFSCSNCAKKNKVKFTINTLTEEALFWWNSFAQPIRVKEAYKITYGSQPSDNSKKDKIQRPSSSTQKNKVEAYPKTVKSSLKNKNYVVEPKGTAIVQHSKLNDLCNCCMLSDNHDLCVLNVINDVNGRSKSNSIKNNSKRKVWKLTGKVFANIRYTWRPTGGTFTIVGNAFPLTRITTTTEVPLRKPAALEIDAPKPVVTLVYSRKPRKSKTNDPVVQIVLWYFDSGCSKHMTGDRSQLANFVNKFLGKVKFRNDHVAKIIGYGDYHIGNVTILRVYYVEGLGYNLFSIGRFYDSNLKVSFSQHICFIRNLEGDDLLTGSPQRLSHGYGIDVCHLNFVAPEPPESTGSPSSTTVNQDVPSPSNSQTTSKTHSPIISNDVEEENHELDITYMNNDPFFEIPIPENDYESSCSDVIPTVVYTVAPNSEHITK
uniref:Reverse transcriptase domain-containing protein n=1 Tax=Tanacetum cinerariifolium TaxID=118510 RepID=A0A6L2MZH7_TANCI|nr:reverse transcriptase domain-containing protein [Tanacetum cinerariifolium]